MGGGGGCNDDAIVSKSIQMRLHSNCNLSNNRNGPVHVPGSIHIPGGVDAMQVSWVSRAELEVVTSEGLHGHS